MRIIASFLLFCTVFTGCVRDLPVTTYVYVDRSNVLFSGYNYESEEHLSSYVNSLFTKLSDKNVHILENPEDCDYYLIINEIKIDWNTFSREKDGHYFDLQEYEVDTWISLYDRPDSCFIERFHESESDQDQIEVDEEYDEDGNVISTSYYVKEARNNTFSLASSCGRKNAEDIVKEIYERDFK